MLTTVGCLLDNGIYITILHCSLCRAADWKLDQPDWTGRLRVCAKGKECYIKIEDKTSGALH